MQIQNMNTMVQNPSTTVLAKPKHIDNKHIKSSSNRSNNNNNCTTETSKMMIRSTLLLLFTATTTTIMAFAPNSSPHASSCRSSELYQTLLHDAEAGKGASWAGARFGDHFLSTGHTWSPSETHGTRSSNAMDLPNSSPSNPRSHHYTRSSTHARSANLIHTSTWSSSAHAEKGNDAYEWSGARRGDYGVISKRAAPTASKWLE